MKRSSRWDKARSRALANLQEMSAEEDALITEAALADPDTSVLTEREWQHIQPHLRRGGRPKALNPKVQLSIRFSPEVVAYFSASGKGWQTRMDEALKDWIAAHPVR